MHESARNAQALSSITKGSQQMSSTPVNLRLFDCPQLGEFGSLEQLLETVQDSGFRIIDIAVWSSDGEIVFSTISYNQEARENMPIAYERHSLEFLVVDDDIEISLGFTLGWTVSDAGSTKRAWIHAYCPDALGENPEHHSQGFLHLGKRLYQTVQPRYGWIERLTFWNPEKAGYTMWEDVEQLGLPHIYWANFFGPAYVEKLGKDILMQAPGWKVEELNDGGLVYVLSPSVAGRSPAAFVREVQSFFGVEHVRRRPRKGRKHSKK